eukprot:9148665-Heterocapsa_arctica.AAC.1
MSLSPRKHIRLSTALLAEDDAGTSWEFSVRTQFQFIRKSWRCYCSGVNSYTPSSWTGTSRTITTSQ